MFFKAIKGTYFTHDCENFSFTFTFSFQKQWFKNRESMDFNNYKNTTVIKIAINFGIYDSIIFGNVYFSKIILFDVPSPNDF